jgi:hypothetical protein
MDFELFYLITQQEYESIQRDQCNGIIKYTITKPLERTDLKDLNKIMAVCGVNDTYRHMGYVDLWDVWQSEDKLYLRHRVLDSTD